MIHPSRFDLIAKYLFIKAKDKQLNTKFFKDLYHNHIITFNNCKEFPDTTRDETSISKLGIKDFFDTFELLIKKLIDNGFDEKYPIPIGNNNIIINGAHRLMICYYYNITPVLAQFNEPGYSGYNYNFFLNRKGNPPLNPIYADTMALEYIKHNPNIRCMIIYPIVYSHNKINQIFNIIQQYGYIYYHTEINLNNNGINNLIKEAYRGEGWIGGLFPYGENAGGKTQLCIGNGLTVYISISMYDVSKCCELKEKCRALFGLGKHSLHMSDYTFDTYRISSSLLNANSIHFLNYGTNDISAQTKQLLTNYFKEVGENNENFCLTSSLIMEMYRLRQAKDIDYLHKDNKILKLEKTGMHDGKWLSYYHVNKDEIIYNPENHFYLNGYKFATLNVVKQMKENRNEKKDMNDLILINKINI